PSTQVGRTKGAFEIHAGGEPDHGPAGKISFQRSAQTRLIGNTRHPSRAGRALIAIATEVQPRLVVLPHALHLQPQRGRLQFRIQHPSHEIPFVRPKMQQAFVVIAGNRILRLGQIKRDGAVFHHHRGACALEKAREHLAERVWSHVARIIRPASHGVSDRWTTKLFGFSPARRSQTSVIWIVILTALRSWDNAFNRCESFAIQGHPNMVTATQERFFFEHYGLTNHDLETYLAAALSAGGDYADLYFEYLTSASLMVDESLVKSASQGISAGCGVRVVSGERTGYAYTDDLSPRRILHAARTAALIASAPAKSTVAGFQQKPARSL